MKLALRNAIALLVMACCLALASLAQQPAPLRAPATPLIVHDPYFSVWSTYDHLTDGPTRHWTGSAQPINGIIRVDGKSWRYLGDADKSLPALEETHRDITPTRTMVTLENPQIELRLCVLTPALPNDLDVMARPVTYLTAIQSGPCIL